MRTEFLKKCTSNGYDERQVSDFIDQKGLPELNYQLFVEAQKNNSYNNPLYEPPEHVVLQQVIGKSLLYEYETHEQYPNQ